MRCSQPASRAANPTQRPKLICELCTERSVGGHWSDTRTCPIFAYRKERAESSRDTTDFETEVEKLTSPTGPDTRVAHGRSRPQSGAQ